MKFTLTVTMLTTLADKDATLKRAFATGKAGAQFNLVSLSRPCNMDGYDYDSRFDAVFIHDVKWTTIGSQLLVLEG